MRSIPSLWIALAAGWVLAASGCSNLTAPAGEDPDSLPQVRNNGVARSTAPADELKVKKSSKKKNKAKRAVVRRILVAYEGAEGAKPGLKRSKAEASKLVRQLLEQLKEPRTNFVALAKEHSDAPEGPRGGLLPTINANSKIDPVVKSAALKTQPGKLSDMLETKQGFVILHRLR